MLRVNALMLSLLANVMVTGVTFADVTPHPLFSDNMVLQQGTELFVWGKAASAEAITVTLTKPDGANAVAQAKADPSGQWSVTLPSQSAGTGYALSIKGANTVDLKNVAVGEVWVCSGQSNMEWSVKASETPQEVAAGAANPNLRLFTVQKRASLHPIDDQGDLTHFTRWSVSSPEAVLGFSAAAYHFGQKLQKELGVPVGLIHSSWGGTPAQAWTSLEALDAEPTLAHYAAAARAAGKAPPKPGKGPGQGTPTVLYNAMIHPLLKFKVKGAIWYQGESNAAKAYEYRTLFTAMIKDWRKAFNTELPFMLVQLAPFKGGKNGVDYAELRDAQLYAATSLPKTGIAVITDVGHETNIHPTPKGPVGERLALAALGIEYGKKIEYYGPMLANAKFAKGSATLTFTHLGGGLVAKDGDLVGFTVAGKDRVFHPATAVIKGDSVVVTSEQVPQPLAVRYGWVNFSKPTLNFFNKAGLPATPFRTDSEPYSSQASPHN